MPKKIETTVYTYAELLTRGDKKAIETAREFIRQHICDSEFWHESVLEEWKEALAQIGFEDAEIMFSGFGSQGDGASFTCKSVDCEKLLAFSEADIKGKDSVGEPDGTNDWRPWLVFHCGQVSGDNKKLKRAASHISASVDRSTSRYVHESTCDFRAELDGRGDYDKIEKHLESFVESAEEYREKLSRRIYRDLESAYFGMQEDDCIAEEADAHDDWFFTADGKRYR